jgi:hypothetical protein
MKNSRIIAVLSLVVALVFAMPMGYFADSVHAQLLPSPTSPTSPPSSPVKTPTPAKAPVIPVKTPTNALKVDVILFGINNKTGNVVTFVTAKNQTATVAVNASDENVKHENSTGVAEVFFTLPNLKLKVGDKFQACNVLIKDLTLTCGTGLKSPLNKTESINILVNAPSSSPANKTTG